MIKLEDALPSLRPKPTEHLLTPPKQTRDSTVVRVLFGAVGANLIFGIIDLIRNQKGRGRGRVMAWIGIGLSLLCVAGIIVAWPALKRQIDKLDNPGCDTASAVLATADADIAAADGNAGTIEMRLRTAIAGLHQAEGQSTNAEATAAIRKLAMDFQEYYDAIDTNQPVAADLTSRIRTDGGAIDGACGRIF